MFLCLPSEGDSAYMGIYPPGFYSYWTELRCMLSSIWALVQMVKKGVWHSLGTGREWEEVGSYCVYEGKEILLFIYLRMLSIKTEKTGSFDPQVLNF